MGISIYVRAAAVLLISQAASAAEPSVARIVELHGHVLVSRGYEMASATQALRLAPDSRLLATTNSTAVVEYHDGCRVQLPPGGRLELRRESPCQSLVAHHDAAAAVTERRQ